MATPNVVGKFFPSTGIIVDRTERSVSITGLMEMHGPEATAARAGSVQHSINSNWTQSFPDGYSVRCNVTVKYRGPGSSPGNATQIEAAKIAGPSHVTPSVFGGRSMTLNANELTAFTWTAAHEFGHIIGLDDRYSEGITSKIRSIWGGQRKTEIQPGYEGNIMGQHSGTPSGQNIADLAAENAPSPYWINDDDEVRDWVNAHPISDITMLSTANKLKAIKTLMGGWISDEDVTAIARICSSVTTRAEADAIRKGVDLSEFSDIGQRTKVRVAFTKMP